MMRNKIVELQLQNLNWFIKIGKMLRPEQLYEHIPRKVAEWNPKDVEKWFTVNNIQTNCNFSFLKEKFNGRALVKATPEYLLEICGVTSRIIMKKIFEWLEYDKEDFEEYVEEHAGSLCPQPETQIVPEEPALDENELEPTQRPSTQKNEIFVQCLPTEKEKSVSPRNICGQNQKHWASIKPMQVQKWKKKKVGSQESIALQKVHSSKENSKKLSNKSQKSLLIGANFVKSSYEYYQSIIEFRFDNKTHFLVNSGKIGRYTTNDIIIVSESVSRLHAQIIKEGSDFYLKDAGSRYGTYVPVGTKNRNILIEGDIIFFEDHQFEVFKYKFYKSNSTFDLKLRSQNEKQTISNFFGKKQVTIGRKGKDIFLNEPTILPNHAKFTFNQSGELTLQEQQGQCYKKLKEDEPIHLQQSDLSLRFGLTVVEIRVIATRKSAPSISEFNFCQ